MRGHRPQERVFSSLPQPRFLPMSRKEMEVLGWDCLDILLVSGDAYVDHPSFGAALLGRLLVSRGLRVGMVAQPRWEDKEDALADVTVMGRPRLFAGVAAGAIDSMLAHYTAFRKKRSDDAYTPGGRAGARPNRAAIVYTGLVRQAFPGIPVVIGGIEASLRRISHYDFWTDTLRRSILLDSKADLLVYGMGESALLAIAGQAQLLLAAMGGEEDSASADACSGRPAQSLEHRSPGGQEPSQRESNQTHLSRADLVRACQNIPGLVWAGAAQATPSGPSVTELPSHETIIGEPALLMQATLSLESQVHKGEEVLVQRSGDRFVAVNPPAMALSEQELDELYGLPFSRLPHPSYTEPIPAWEMIRTSITTHRGCGGGCSFCSLALHQGRRIASRSRDSILAEARHIAEGPEAAVEAIEAQHGADAKGRTNSTRETKAPPRWAGAISDVGGPSANMWQAECTLPHGKVCAKASCMHPGICPFFSVDQRAGVNLLRAVAAQEGVNHVRVASGVRFDLALQDEEALCAYTKEFTGGQLKVAPEHSENAVLALMRKPPIGVFETFLDEFARHSGQSGKDLYTVPYLISAFPGCTEEHMRRLAAWLQEKHWKPQQVQCFIPTPGTVATAMYYAGIDPQGRPIRVARTDKDRLRQHHLLLGDERPLDQRGPRPRERGAESPERSRPQGRHPEPKGRNKGRR